MPSFKILNSRKQFNSFVEAGEEFKFLVQISSEILKILEKKYFREYILDFTYKF